MSMWATAQAWACETSPQTKLALLAIADSTFEDERDPERGIWLLSFNCFENYGRLAKKCGMQAGHFGEIVRLLRADGLLLDLDDETKHLYERTGFFVRFRVYQLPEDDE